MEFRRTSNSEIFGVFTVLAVFTALPACGNDQGYSGNGTGGQAGVGAAGGGGMPIATGGVPAATGGASSGGMTPGMGGAPGTGGMIAGGGTAGSTANGGAAGGYMAPKPALPTPVSYVAGGNFAPLAAYASRTTISGHAQILRDAMGKTTVQLHVEGLDPSVMYPAHVHSLPCSVDSAGDHYKIDPTVTMTDPNNEIHIPFMTDANGMGRASITKDHFARPDAQSVVIHDPSSTPANAKMVCADLLPEPAATVTSKGTFAPFASASMKDAQIAGTATLVRDATGTTVTVAPTGLDSASMYMAHVHQYPCAVNSAGGHYKLDPTNMMTLETNELWPPLASGSAPLKNAQVARPDAESLVIHRADPMAMAPPKVACADLVRVEPYDPYKTEGMAKLTGDGMSRYASLTASGTMTRTMPSTTTATVTVSGLGKSMMYGIHVHELSCANTGGGGHYKIDPTMTMAMQSNEIWLSLMTDANGGGMQMASVTTHLARPEAASIVIHDSDAMGTRIACIDLK